MKRAGLLLALALASTLAGAFGTLAQRAPLG